MTDNKVTFPHDLISVPRELLEDVFESLLDLRSEWDWKKDEPRAGNQRVYDELCAKMEKLKPLIGYPKAAE